MRVPFLGTLSVMQYSFNKKCKFLGVSGYTVTTVPQKPRQDFQEFKAKLDYKGRPCFKTLIQSKCLQQPCSPQPHSRGGPMSSVYTPRYILL